MKDSNRVKWLGLIVLVLGGLLLYMLFTNARAQGLDVPGVDFTNFFEWFTNPVVFIVAIGALVNWERDLAPWIDGKPRVFAATIVTGAGLGLVGDIGGWLTVLPFADMALPWGGLAYGGVGGASAFLGVNFFQYFQRKRAEAQKALPDESTTVSVGMPPVKHR